MARGLIQPITQLTDPEWEPGELVLRYGSGRVCLDLVRTVGERWRRSFERLRSPVDLDRWLVGTGLITEPPSSRRRDLVRARELREAIYGLARAAMDGTRTRAGDVEVVNASAARPDLAPQLRAGRLMRLGRSHPVDAALATVARDAVELFGGPLAAQVRECAAPDCSGIFLDTSRAGARRWCSMATGCGNKRKVAAYRARRATTRRATTRRATKGAPAYGR
jgi:predicted RNA-binding Zn ribbon-like protein